MSVSTRVMFRLHSWFCFRSCHLDSEGNTKVTSTRSSPDTDASFSADWNPFIEAFTTYYPPQRDPERKFTPRIDTDWSFFTFFGHTGRILYRQCHRRARQRESIFPKHRTRHHRVGRVGLQREAPPQSSKAASQHSLTGQLISGFTSSSPPRLLVLVVIVLIQIVSRRDLRLPRHWRPRRPARAGSPLTFRFAPHSSQMSESPSSSSSSSTSMTASQSGQLTIAPSSFYSARIRAQIHW